MSSGSGGAKGGEWRDQVVFVPDAGPNPWGKTEIIKDFWLIPKMAYSIDDSEKIKEISVYKKPLLTSLQGVDYQELLNHQFVVLETANWFWSIEKDGEQIVIRRGGDFERIKNFDLEGERIKPVVLMSNDKGTKTMKDLIEFLYLKDEVLKTYHLRNDNCQHFAKRVFDEFAERKKHDIKKGCEITGV